MMTAKTFLREVRHEQTEVARLESKLEYLKKSTLPGGIRYDKDKVQTSPDDRISDIMAEIGDIEMELEEDIYKLLKDISQAYKMIGSLTSSKHRDVMRCYYLPDVEPGGELPTWDDVADRMHYTREHVLRLHGEALKEMNDATKCYYKA